MRREKRISCAAAAGQQPSRPPLRGAHWVRIILFWIAPASLPGNTLHRMLGGITPLAARQSMRFIITVFYNPGHSGGEGCCPGDLRQEESRLCSHVNICREQHSKAAWQKGVLLFAVLSSGTQNSQRAAAGHSLQLPAPSEGDAQPALYHRNLLPALSEVLAEGQVPAVPVAVTATLPRGAEPWQSPAALPHAPACEPSEHGRVNASGMTNRTSGWLSSSKLRAEGGLFSEKPRGKKKKK